MASQTDLERALYGAYLGLTEAQIAVQTLDQLRAAFAANGPLSQAQMNALYVKADATGKTYTQTFNTPSRTVPAAAAVAASSTAASNVTPWGYTTQAQADGIRFQLNTLITDVDALRKVVTQIIDDLQGYGLVG